MKNANGKQGRGIQVSLVRIAFTGMSLLLVLPLCGCGSSKSPNQTTAGVNSRVKTSGMKPIASGPVKYIALGDSTGVGVGASQGGYVARLFKRIEVQRPGSTVINLCFSGATSEDVVSNQLERALAREPTLVTLGIGINDIGHGIALEQFAENYEKILSQLRAKTKASILVTNIPDISTAPAIPPSLRDQMGRRIVLFNERIAEVTSKHEVAVFDIYSSTHEVLASRPELFSGDGFHPSDAGYEHWANEMWPVIAEALR